MKSTFDRRDEYEQDVFAGESPLIRRKSWDDLDYMEQEEDGLGEFDLEEYERDAYEEDK